MRDASGVHERPGCGRRGRHSAVREALRLAAAGLDHLSSSPGQ